MRRVLLFALFAASVLPPAVAQTSRPVRSAAPAAVPAAAGTVLREAVSPRASQRAVRVDAPPTAAQLAAGLASTAFRAHPSGAAHKLDARARMLQAFAPALGKNLAALDAAATDLAVRAEGGALWVDLLVQVQPSASADALTALGAQVQTRVGDIVALRVPLDRLDLLAARPEVLRVETSRRLRPTMYASRADIRADLVHSGVGLPRPIQGEGVVVGVLDSGLDVTHPDFFDEGGSRVQFLLEYQQGGGHATWTKAQIDANPAGVTERDGNGGGGHGTHVTGTAAGGGRADASMRGIAPKADIVFVKGVREPDSDGGFSNNDVLTGCQYIFDRAAALGKPAVINLSLGGNGGPLDGTSLQDQALSQLVGPGRLIVAAGGNEGFDLIHAGGTSVAGVPSQTLLTPAGSAMALADLWYPSGTVSEIALGAYLVDNDNVLRFVGFSGWMPVGNSFTAWEPFVIDGTTVAEYYLDASTTQAPVSGDGNALYGVRGVEGIDHTQLLWAVLSRGTRAGRLDLWAQGGEFVNASFGLAGFTEMPGNTDLTIGSPASARRVIAVASYVTTNTWTNVDGNRYEVANPNPNRAGGAVVPVLGQRSYFSSVGPTRDGRQKPDIAAPGERIFSTLSSHLTEGVGYQRSRLVGGGRYMGTQGTSMASPHVTGVIALMLQVYPAMDYADALAILQQTARADAQTGTVPNVQWGAGRVDALAAVQEALRRAGGTPTGPVQRATLARFDPAGVQRNYSLDAVMPVDSGFVAGMNLYSDRAKATLYDLPAGVTTAEVTGVDVWFGYKRANTTRTYAIEVYATSGDAPGAAPLYRKEYPFSHALADADFSTREAPTTHAFDKPVRVDGPFYVSVDFGTYGVADAGALSVTTTDLRGAALPHVWERWADGSWHRLADAWDFGQGTSTDAPDLWMQANVQYVTATATADGDVPGALILRLAGPNPFRTSTTLSYALPSTGPVAVAVYDLLGRRVATLVDGEQPAGTYSVPFTPASLASGLYFVRLTAPGGTRVERLVYTD